MTLLDHALGYARLGLRIFPLVWHGHPDPDRVVGTPLVKWGRDATTNEKQIRAWWQQWPNAGIGLACGDDLGPNAEALIRHLFVVDLDRHDPANDGIELFADLVDQHEEIDEGPLVLTAGGGHHLYFTAPTPITNSSGALPTGIDVRGAGGYVVLPPSTHKTGGRHEWEADHELGELPIPAAPGWLLELITADDEPERNTSATGTNTTPDPYVDVWDQIDDRPGTDWARSTDWKTLLEADGWTYIGIGTDGEEQWSRPGQETRGKVGGTVNFGGADRLVVHSTNANVPADSYSKLGYYAAAHHAGDFRAAVRELAPATPDTVLDRVPTNVDPDTGEIVADDRGDDWEPVDVVDIGRKIAAGEWKPELPAYLNVAESFPLLYAGRSHVIFGPPGGGKTWVALAAVAERLIAGDPVLMLDWEDSAAGTVDRLLRLGVTVEQLSRFDYRSVVTSLAYGWPILEATETAYVLVVIDSTGEALAAQGVNPNDDGEVASWMTYVKRLSLREASPAVLLLDHVPKSTENPHGAPIGSQRKLAAVTGSAYRCDTKIEPAKGKEGKLTLTVAKDRLGHRAKGTIAAEVHVADTDEGIGLTFSLTEAQSAVARGETFFPTVLMERVSRYLEENPGATKNQIEKTVDGKASGIRKAIDALVDLGFVRQSNAGGSLGMLHNVEHSYREGDSLHASDPNQIGSENDVRPVDNHDSESGALVTSSPSSHLVPTSSRDEQTDGSNSPRPPRPTSSPRLNTRDEGRGRDERDRQGTDTYLVPPGEPDTEPVDNPTTREIPI